MYSRILVPLDGSEMAEQVLPYVRLLAKGLSTRVLLFQVFLPSLPAVLAAGVGGEPLSVKRKETRDYLEKVSTSLKKDGLEVSFDLHEHTVPIPADRILNEAEKDSSTLIAMTTHGRSGISRWLLGSVTDKVIQAATNPLLLIRSGEQKEFKADVKVGTIMVPLDGSKLAEQVLPHVVALSRALQSEVALVRITPGLSPTGEVPGHYPPRQPDPQDVEYIREVNAKLLEEGVSSVKEIVSYGSPDELVLDTALEIPNNLVAMTTHGRSGVGRWWLGSVADRVVRYSGGPVLLIRAVKATSD